MSIKRVNPHHLDINSSSSLINLSFASDNKIEMSMEEIAAQMRRKMKFLSMIVGVIYNKRVANAFSNIKFKPLRTYYLKRRLVEVFLGVLRRSDYNNKYEAFLKLKKLLIK